jgi:type IVB pilus formation R64 PilN family outer membrane protein
MRRPVLLAAVALSGLAAAGCTQTRQTADAGFARATAQADRDLAVRQGLEAYRGPVNVRMSDGVWLGETGQRNPMGEPLPGRLETRTGVVLNAERPLSLDQIAQRLSEITGIRHTVDGVAAWQGAAPAAENPAAQPPADVVGPAFDAPGPVLAAVGGMRPGPMTVRYSGPLSGLLNQIAAHFEVDWEHRDGVVRFQGVQTRQFTLQALPNEVEVENRIQGAVAGLTGVQGAGTGGQGGGGQQSSQQAATNRIRLNYWTAVEATIKSMLPDGTPVAINRDAGTISITARPSLLRQVEQYIRTENRRLARQVAIEVKVLSIQARDADNYNFNLGVLFRDIANGINLGFSSVTPIGAIANGALISAGIVQNARQNWINQSFQGSEAFIRALSERTNASLVTSASVTALNNQVAPLSILNTRGYLARVTQTQVEGASTPTTSLEPGSVSTGFSMSVLPRIFSNGELIMNYNISLSELVGDTFETFSSGNQTIQLPNINSRALSQSVRMRSGDSLVLGGFERVRNSASDRGIGQPTFRLFGGGMDNANLREILVVVITPVILESSGQLQAAQR